MLREFAPETAEFALLEATLNAAGLPIEDMLSEPFRYYCFDDVAWGGIGEGADALLRSVIVKPKARNRGYGALATNALAAQARANGVARLWLLTTDASAFFARLGWRKADRAGAPPAIAASRQFSGLCPASAMLMVRAL